MIRSTFETGRWLALVSWCACSPGAVLDADPGAAHDGRPGGAPRARPASTMTMRLQPSATGASGRSAPSWPDGSAVAGSVALEARLNPPAAGGGEASPPAGRDRVFGVTITDVSPLEGITQALGSLSRKPTTRVVFDAKRSANTYTAALRQISAVSYVMGELVDSVAVAELSVDAYAARTNDYLSELADLVDIWEIGNEVNGEWLGPAKQVSAKLEVAYSLVAAQDKPTALTLYYNEGCVQDPQHELFAWVAARVSPALRAGLDYVWVSYYEQRCHRPEPDWGRVFARLHELFPSAALGIGGCGASDPARKAETLRHFYGLEVDAPSFVGGFFWWYFREDMQPASRPLWEVLNGSWARAPL